MHPGGLVSVLDDHARGGKTLRHIAAPKVFDLEHVAGLGLNCVLTLARVAVQGGQVCALLRYTVRPDDRGIRLEGCHHVRDHWKRFVIDLDQG